MNKSGRGADIVISPNWSTVAKYSYINNVPLAVKDEGAFYRACERRVQYMQRRECRPWMWRRLATEFQKAKGTKRSYMAEWCQERACLYDG